jgi:hypothetical protein
MVTWLLRHIFEVRSRSFSFCIVPFRSTLAQPNRKMSNNHAIFRAANEALAASRASVPEGPLPEDGQDGAFRAFWDVVGPCVVRFLVFFVQVFG